MSGELIKHARGVVVLNGIINHSFRSSVESGHALFWFSESRAEYTDLQGAWQIHQRFSIALFPILGCAAWFYPKDLYFEQNRQSDRKR